MQRRNLHRRTALVTIRARGIDPTMLIAGFMVATAFPRDPPRRGGLRQHRRHTRRPERPTHRRAAVFLAVAWFVLTRVLFEPEIDRIPGGRSLIDRELERLGPPSSGPRRVRAGRADHDHRELVAVFGIAH